MPIRPAFFVVAFLLTGIVYAQNDLTEIPEPDPVAEREAMKIHEGAAVNLFAADPDISKPIQMNFDSTGGLWIASSSVYPQIEPGEIANDKIIVLRDTDGDGISDSQTVFADGLLIPTGILPDGPDAAYIAESTRLLYMRDTDGDGRADIREVVLSGFGTEDTHHLVHTLRFGPDGCVYFNQSIYIHSHIDTPFGSKHLDGGGIWRYRPSTRELEVVCKGFVNPWGHSFDRNGESFATDGAYFDGINYVFPDSVFVTSPGATRWLRGMNPGSPKHCGLEILSGTHIPPDWSGSFVTSDFRSHRVCRFTVKPSGSGYFGRQLPEIITTPHVAFRPIDARMGPDGALYVADWYNPIIQHGEVDFRDERRDRTHGRIWRVSFPDRELDPWPDFANASIDQLLGFLEDPSLAAAQFSRQELWKRAENQPDAVLNAVRDWSADHKNSRTNELLWMNEVVPQPTMADIEHVIDSFDSIDAEYRRTAMRSIWRSRVRFAVGSAERDRIEAFALGGTTDADPRVRLEAVVCAGQLSETAALDAVLAATKQDVDDNLDFAIWQSIRSLQEKHAADNEGHSILAQMDWSGRVGQLARAVSAIGTAAACETALSWVEKSKQAPAEQGALVGAIASSGDASQLGRLAKTLLVDQGVRSIDPLLPLVERTARDKTVPVGVGEVLAGLVKTPSDLTSTVPWASAVATMATTWKVGQLETVIAETITATDQQELRNQLIASLGTFESPSAAAKIDELSKSDDTITRIVATRAMSDRRPRSAIDPIVAMLGQATTSEVASEMMVGLMSRQGIDDAFAQAIEKTELNADVARGLLARVRGAGGSDSLQSAIRGAGKLENAAWKLTPEFSKSLIAKVHAEGSAVRGEQIYRRQALQCINCHAIGSAGGLVGPNLISLGGSAQLDYIVESMLDPSAKLKEGYTTLSVLTDDGQLFNGIAIGKTDEAIMLRLADGKEVQIEIDSIEVQKPGKSLMPEGLLDSLTQSELVDLITFLSELGRTPAYTVSTDPLVRSFETLVYSDEANRIFNRTSTDAVAADDVAMVWRPVTATVDGKIPVGELDRFQQHRETPPTSFVRFDVNMPAAGDVEITLPADGIAAWVDGKPTPTWNLKSLELGAGKHPVVLSIDRTLQDQPLSIRVAGDATP